MLKALIFINACSLKKEATTSMRYFEATWV